jgi:hypothetical protein
MMTGEKTLADYPAGRWKMKVKMKMTMSRLIS